MSGRDFDFVAFRLCRYHSFPESSGTGTKKEAEAQKIYVTDLKGISDIQYDVKWSDPSDKEDNVWYDGEDPDFPLAQSYPKQMEDTLEKLQAERKLEEEILWKTMGCKTRFIQ